MQDFLTAIALALAIEGFLYALFPDAMKKAMLQMLAQPSSAIRIAGLTVATVGVILVWLIRG